ncbi:MAG: hypothetical protein KBG20_03395 [Caldilineaceae bacterium]|nr:hypothetical protein [Caldilineaceae bacterium]MBP8108574.1 hypothetical protein [Caldilineaceae bacterium]MBP8124398.1 hypothetical protein [Caldilineaceae bacterium]MBP9071312.1 hypothetical protein [Caldilineaceae bacterium]
MSVIDSLSAGFRFLGRRFELLLIPILLDLFLWIAPQLSVAPLLQRIEQQAIQSASAPDMPPDALAMIEQLTQVLDPVSRGLNLFSALVNQNLLHVPSLMASLGLGEPSRGVRSISDMGIFLFSMVLLTVVGMWIGTFYLGILARQLPLGEGNKTTTVREFMVSVFQHWLWLLVFVVGLGVALLLLFIPTFALALILTAISPALAPGATAIASGVILSLLFYMYFVVAGLILDDLDLQSAVWRSVLLVRYNFWSTLGFIGVTLFITFGFIQIWLILVESVTSPIILWLAVLGNAYIGTGLAMSLFVFYRTRLLRTADQLNPAS